MTISDKTALWHIEETKHSAAAAATAAALKTSTPPTKALTKPTIQLPTTLSAMLKQTTITKPLRTTASSFDDARDESEQQLLLLKSDSSSDSSIRTIAATPWTSSESLNDSFEKLTRTTTTKTSPTKNNRTSTTSPPKATATTTKPAKFTKLLSSSSEQNHKHERLNNQQQQQQQQKQQHQQQQQQQHHQQQQQQQQQHFIKESNSSTLSSPATSSTAASPLMLENERLSAGITNTLSSTTTTTKTPPKSNNSLSNSQLQPNYAKLQQPLHNESIAMGATTTTTAYNNTQQSSTLPDDSRLPMKITNAALISAENGNSSQVTNWRHINSSSNNNSNNNSNSKNNSNNKNYNNNKNNNNYKNNTNNTASNKHNSNNCSNTASNGSCHNGLHSSAYQVNSNNNNNNNNNNSYSSSTTTTKSRSLLLPGLPHSMTSSTAAGASTAAASTTSSTCSTGAFSPSSSSLSSSSSSPSSSASCSSSSPGASFNCCSNFIARCCLRLPQLKAINMPRCLYAVFAIVVVYIFYCAYYVDTGVFVGLIQRDTRPSPLINCRMTNGKQTRGASPAPDHRSEARLRIDPKVLVFVETTYSGLGRDIAELLVYNRIKYKVEVAGKSLPQLTNLDKGRYGVIVFENLDKYLNMDKWNRELLDKYCREYSVGIVGFVSPSEETLVAAQLRDFPIFIHTNLRLRDASLNPASSVLRLTRAGETAWGALPGDDWAVFQHNHSTYEPIEWAQRNTADYPSDSGGQVQLPLTTVLQDHGQLDGIQRVLFGSSLRFWLHRLLFLDALSYLSHGQLSLSLERMLLVDIDDIFVGEKGTRLRPDDVRALVATQKIIASMVPGFRFNLGFSGKYYHHGTREENLGDDFLLDNVHEFNWFSHMWKHQQPHLYDNLTLLMSEMQLNYAFAKEHDIPTDSGYSISPHHSGVYPAHELLYVAWKKVWNVKVTSTEEYPHLRPARLRRGFIHRNIMVLPRQTCGLFTHTMYIDRYPGGRDKLDESIQGGELFQTIVYNPINIFMTHMSNYGSDRLALYTFQSVIKFLQCWTNLKLGSAPPIKLAEMYFRLHPEEVDPVWGNPCDDVRHKKIWSKTKNCDSLPKFLVIGPQKTGTTALYTFLSMHSSIASNVPSPDTFEEIQFFNGNNYYRGLDWYMDFFPSDNGGVGNASTISPPTSLTGGAGDGARYMFEKSATYFDGDVVPKRAHALLPHAKIVTILISPAKRAYSWYQHQRAHGDAVANNYTFYQVITATDAAPKTLKDLRNRCLNPGKYAQHLEHWLAYYPAQQLHIIDGEQLRLNPIDVMNDLQRFLKIQPSFDYSNHLRFDTKKGFFCQVVNEKRNKCLGKSKGRQYPPMDERSSKLLQRYYLNSNTALVKLLKKLGSRPIPQWLKDDLSTST